MAAGWAQAPPAYFELQLPEFKQTLGSGNVVATLPPRAIGNLQVQLLGSADQNLNYGQVMVRINGKGVGNLFDRKSNERGKFLVMDSNTLSQRRDPIFDPAENAIEVYGTGRGRSYYQNWILRSSSARENSWYNESFAISPDDARGVPPDLLLSQPTAAPALRAGAKTISVHLKGTASAGPGLLAINLNGALWKDPRRALTFDFDETVSVPVESGQISLEVVDSKHNQRTIHIPVAAPAADSRPIRFTGEKFALVIGISRFGAKQGAPPELTGAASDADQFAELLVTAAGFKKQNIQLLRDENATSEQMRIGFRDFVARAQRDDLLLIYVATQGVHDPDHPEHAYLAGYDTQIRQLSQTAIEAGDLEQYLNKSVHSRNTLMMFDAGHELNADWAFSGSSLINTFLLNLASPENGRSALVSGGANQISKGGLFAKALAEGLSGKADLDHNQVITPGEIFRYVTDKVRADSAGAQTPRFRTAPEAAPVLSLK